ncbi:MAG: DUF2589 domain-containing protein [Prochloraceae cyanobacterium]|nr:DUF2589 domain-containing protein [Prochloraceae cyanobacterium]
MADNEFVLLKDILSAPLISTIEADIAAAQKVAEFVQKYGFEKVEDESMNEAEAQSGNPYGQLKMVNFWYSRYNPSQEKNDYFLVRVPVLSLITLPLLQIDTATFDFNITIHIEKEKIATIGQLSENLSKTTEQLEAEERQQEQQESKVGKIVDRFKARLAPILGAKDGESRIIDANMQVKVQMRQADMPAGLIRLMSVFNESTSAKSYEEKIEAKKVDEEKSESSSEQQGEASSS